MDSIYLGTFFDKLFLLTIIPAPSLPSCIKVHATQQLETSNSQRASKFRVSEAPSCVRAQRLRPRLKRKKEGSRLSEEGRKEGRRKEELREDC
jgi:hypothetical protein